MIEPKCVRGVSWFNRAEWEVVCAKVFSTEIEERQWAVERMLIWQARSHPKTPVAVDVTAAIVRAQICDELQRTGSSSFQHSEISHLYAMGIIRFINLISELGQNSERQIAVRQLAQKFRIPEWMVDLRHQSTHATTPSLEMLRVGAEFALCWLKLKYWDIQREAVSDWTPPSSTALPPKEAEEAMRALVLSYKELQDEVFRGRGAAKKAEKDDILRQLAPWMRDRRFQLLEILTESGNMLPTELQLQSLLGNQANAFLQGTSVSLPVKLEKYWLPVLKLMHDAQAFQQFLELLLWQDRSDELLHLRLATAWIRKMLEAVTMDASKAKERGKVKDKRTMRPVASPLVRLVKTKPALQWKKLLEASLRAPNMYSPEIMTVIVDRVNPPLTDFQRHHLMALVAIHIGHLTGESGKDFQLIKRVFQVEDLIHISPAATVKTPQQATTEDATSDTAEEDIFNIAWERCSDNIKWDDYPLGSILDESVILAQNDNGSVDLRDSPLQEDDGMLPTPEAADNQSVPCEDAADLPEGDPVDVPPKDEITESILKDMCMHLKGKRDC